MYHKNFSYFSITLLALEALTTCYAMDIPESDERGQRGISSAKTPGGECLQDERGLWAQQACSLYKRAQEMDLSWEKADAYGTVVKLVEPHIDAINSLAENNKVPKIAQISLNKILANSLEKRGKIFFELIEPSLSSTKPTQVISKLHAVAECFKRSYFIYLTLEPEEKKSHKILNKLGCVLEILATYYRNEAIAEKNSAKKIETHLKGIDILKESLTIKRPENVKACRLVVHAAIRESIKIYFQEILLCTQNVQEKEAKKKYNLLVDNIDLLKKILNICEQCLIEPFSSIDRLFVEEKPLEHNPKKSGKHKKRRNQQHQTPPQQQMTFLNPQDFVMLIYNTYCGMLREAGTTLSEIPVQNEMLAELHQKKEKELLELAFKTYKEKVYKEEYAHDAEKEKAFIEARLNDLTGNAEPLKEFYRTLHQEKQARQRQMIVRQIKEEREERERQAEKEKEMEQLRGKEKTTNRSTSTTTTTSDLSASYKDPFEDRPQEKYTKPEPRVKEKTRGTPHPTPPTEMQPQKMPATVKKTIVLGKESYPVFQSLTGKSPDKNITRQQVKKLLADLECKITPAGGSHEKATASNNKVWTIPPEWDGPIPAPYRQQLMHFLLGDMEINSGELEVKVKE